MADVNHLSDLGITLPSNWLSMAPEEQDTWANAAIAAVPQTGYGPNVNQQQRTQAFESNWKTSHGGETHWDGSAYVAGPSPVTPPAPSSHTPAQSSSSRPPPPPSSKPAPGSADANTALIDYASYPDPNADIFQSGPVPTDPHPRSEGIDPNARVYTGSRTVPPAATPPPAPPYTPPPAPTHRNPSDTAPPSQSPRPDANPNKDVNSLPSVSEARDTWLRAQQATDDRTQRIVRKATELLRGEYAIQMGCSDVTGLLATEQLSNASPWNGDIFAVQAWVWPPTASVTLTLVVVRITDVTTQVSILTTPIVAAPSFRIADQVTVDETDLTGGANIPDLTTLDLAVAGVTTNLNSGDVVYCLFSAVSGTPTVFGLQLKCTLRVAQDVLPVGPP